MALEVFELGEHLVRLPAWVKWPIAPRFTLNLAKIVTETSQKVVQKVRNRRTLSLVGDH